MATKTKKTTKEIVIKSYDLTGKETGVVEVAKEILSYTPNSTLLAQYVRVFQANQRQGTASAKMRSEVAGTTKKVYKQKGTGRARHGSMKAPIYKGGGVVGGPKPKEYRMSFSKQQKTQSMLSAIAFQIHRGTVAVLENAAVKVAIKTKPIASLLKTMALTKQDVLFVLPDAKAQGLVKSIHNIENAQVTHMGMLNVHELLDADHVIVIADAFDAMQHLFTT